MQAPHDYTRDLLAAAEVQKKREASISPERLRERQSGYLDPMAQRAQGIGPSPARIQQQLALQQARAAMAPRPGGALAHGLQLQGMAAPGSQMLAQLGQSRAQEIAQARAAYLQAALQARANVYNQEAFQRGLQLDDRAAQLTRQGSMISGLTGLAGLGMMYAMQPGGGRAAAPGEMYTANVPDPLFDFAPHRPSLGSY